MYPELPGLCVPSSDSVEERYLHSLTTRVLLPDAAVRAFCDSFAKLHKCETSLFFPWLRELLPREALPALEEFDREREAVVRIGNRMGQARNLRTFLMYNYSVTVPETVAIVRTEVGFTSQLVRECTVSSISKSTLRLTVEGNLPEPHRRYREILGVPRRRVLFFIGPVYFVHIMLWRSIGSCSGRCLQMVHRRVLRPAQCFSPVYEFTQACLL